MSIFGKNKQNTTARGTAPARSPSSASEGTGIKTSQLNISPSARSEGSDQTDPRSDGSGPSKGENGVGSIGKSIIIKGELSGNEDLEVDGTVEGDIRLPDHVLTIGPNGQVSASVLAKSIHVIGCVKGDVEATERIEIETSGLVEGDIRSPRLLIHEGAVVNGKIEMSGSSSESTNSSRTKRAAPANSESEASIQAV